MRIKMLMLPALLLMCSAAAKAADPAVITLRPSSKSINTVKFFADSNRIACGGDDELLHIWDIALGKEVGAMKGHTAPITDVAIAMNQGRLSTVSQDKTFRVWDVAPRKVVFTLTAPQPLLHVAYSLNTLYTVVGSEGGSIIVDLRTRAFMKDWPTEPVGNAGVAWSKDGTRLATSGLDNVVNVFDGTTFQKTKSLEGTNLKSSFVRFSPDGKLLVSAHENGTLRLWDVEAGKQVSQLSGHSTPVSSADFSPDGKLLLSTAADKTVILWDVASGKSLQRQQAAVKIHAAAFAPTGTAAALAGDDGSVLIVPLLSTARGPALARLGEDPNQIERAEFRDKPKPIVKSLMTINAMTVLMNDTVAMGMIDAVNMNVPGDSRTAADAGTAHMVRDVGKQMKISFDEAARAVKVRYPQWTGGRIDVSFDDKYTGVDGGSAGTAFAVLMLSALEGFDIDPKFAVTGDISVNWKVLEIGGVPHKLAGAVTGKCAYAAIPEANETSFADMGLMEGHHAYWDLQVFSIGTLQQAVALARVDRDADLDEAMKLFAALPPQLAKAEAATLKKPETVAALKHILELAPNHLSAKYTLALATNSAPKTLSKAATMYRLYQVLGPYRQSFRSDLKDEDVVGVNVPPALAVLTRQRLDALRLVGNKDMLPLITEVAAFVETANSITKGSTQLKTYLAQRKSIRARFSNLTEDPNYLTRALRDGY